MIGVRMINRLLGLEVEIRKIELSVAAVSKDSKEYLEAKEKKDILVKQFEENLKKGKEILENPPEEIILLSLPTAGIYLHASNNDNIQFHFVLFATKNAEELKEKYQTLLDFGDTGDSQVTNIRSSQSRRDPSTLTIDLSDRVYPVKNSDPAWIVLHESIHFEGPHHPDTDYVGIQRLKDKKYFFMLVNGTDVVVTQGQGGGA